MPRCLTSLSPLSRVALEQLAHEKHGYLRNEGGGASAISFARDVLGRRLTPEALDTCGMQAHCFIFTESPYCTGSCNCQYQVCIDYNKVSGCKDAVSHAIRTRDCLNVTCNKVEPFGEASGALCEVVEKGGTARFVIKDGSHCIVDTFDVPGWQCQPGTEPFPCGGEGNFDQECVWWHTVPESFPLPTFDKPYPEDVNSNCSNIPDPPTVTAKDACGNVVSNVVFSTTTNGTVCTGQNITRTWTATDTCDGSATLTQHVIVAPDTDGPNVVPPPDTTLDCPADLDPGKTGRPTVSDLCSNVGSITYLDAEVPGNCTGNKAIERTWKALDDCGNAGIATQHIVVRDITKPTITCPADADNIDCNGGCSDVGCLGTAIATDKCDATPTITHTDTRTPLENPTHASTDVDVTISRTWTATDSCGNQHTCVQTIRTPGILTELQVVKKTNGAIDPTKDWVVTLSFDSKAIASGTTLNLPDSAGGMVLDWFIDPSLTYTVCESTVPAGWSALWTVNGNSVVPSNPDGPTENVGRLCYDLHPASLRVTCHDTITLDMNNIPPQGKGCPRTPGDGKVRASRSPPPPLWRLATGVAADGVADCC